jgi:ABC-2 type transport system permease protein
VINLGKIRKNIENVLNITKYSIKMFFRDKTAIFFSLFVPILIMAIFGVLNFGGELSLKVGIVDNSKSPLSTGFVDALKQIEGLEISQGAQDSELEALKQSDRNMVLVIPTDFATAVSGKVGQTPELKTYYNASDNQTNTEIGYTIVGEVLDGMSHQITKSPKMFTISRESVATTELKYINFIIPGIVAMSIMQMSIFGVVGAIVSWRERGILRRLLATPVRPAAILFSQVVTRLLISVAQVALLVTLGVVFFNLQIVGSYWLLLLLVIFGSIIFLSMGFAMSGAGSQNTVMALSNLVVMPQMFLSGVFFPRELMPDWLNKVTAYLPLTYLADAMRGVINKGADIASLSTEFIGLAVWGVIAFVISTRIFRWE